MTQSVQFTDDTSTFVAVNNGSVSYIAAWPCQTWRAEEIDQILSDLGLSEPLACEVEAITPADLKAAVQDLLDKTANERSYNDGATLASYASSTNATWAAEASAFIAWRDAVWTATYAALDAADADGTELEDIDTFLASLPVLDWPDTSDEEEETEAAETDDTAAEDTPDTTA